MYSQPNPEPHNASRMLDKCIAGCAYSISINDKKSHEIPTAKAGPVIWSASGLDLEPAASPTWGSSRMVSMGQVREATWASSPGVPNAACASTLAKVYFQGHLGDEHQHRSQRPKSPHAGVFHDFESAVTLVAASQTIGHIGQAVFMEAASQHHREHGAECSGQQGRVRFRAAGPGRRQTRRRPPRPRWPHRREMRHNWPAAWPGCSPPS